MKCLDTYALVEISRGNPNFSNYLNENSIIPDLIFAEFYSVILREYNEKTANYWFRQIESRLVPINVHTMIKAVKFRQENKKQNLSFFDCVGYTYAIENGMKFVTGDREFKDKVGVEFK